MKKLNLTYEKSGVNIKAADKFINYISNSLKKTRNSVNFKNIGGFGAVTKIPKNLKAPYLVTCTDGVGTKLEIANKINNFSTIGIDLVAMSVNDLIVQGAKPLLFLDYISIDKINLIKLKSIIKGIIKGCKIANCDLAGGETAEMPGTYSKNKFDLAGFAVGLVDGKNILLKSNVKKGDLILAVPSNGVHSNGYSLIRKILRLKKINITKNSFLKRELIRPTKIYVKEILPLIKRNLINICSNITGGGIEDNLKRVLPNNVNANINLKKIRPSKIFKWIKSNGINDSEMLKTFNCGVGFCLIIKKNNENKIKKFFSKKFEPYTIGEITSGSGKIKLYEKIDWGK